MNVKNKIASFEAYNKEVSDSMVPKQTTNVDDDGTGSAVSSTSKASQNRRNRLSSNSPLRSKQEEHQKPRRGSFAERRRLRQQQQQRRKNDVATPPSVPPAGQSTGNSSYQQSSYNNNNKSEPHFTVSSNRRFVHTISHESSDEMVGKSGSAEGAEGEAKGGDLLSPNRRLSPARIAKAYRMQRMRSAATADDSPTSTPKNQYSNNNSSRVVSSPKRSQSSMQQPPGSSTSPRTPQTYRSYEDDDTQFNSVTNMYTNDDDATLTSVRQIVTGSNNDLEKSQEIHRNVVPTAGYDATKQSWVQNGQKQQQQQQQRQNGVVLRMASSSDYDSDGNNKSDANAPTRRTAPPPNSAMKAFIDQSRKNMNDDDDRTFDYGSLNDESTHGSFDTQKREAERKAKETMDQHASVGFVPNEETSPLINQDDLEYYKKSLDSGVVKAAAGVVAAGAVGGLVLGPVGILLGVAAVGIGVGAMQIPEEQRANVKEKATSAVLSATDKISTSCATACVQSGVIDQLPPEMTKCYSPADAEDGTDGTVTDPDSNENGSVRAPETTENGEKTANTNFNTTMRGLIPEGNGRKSASPARRAACLRDVRIIPVSQIHGLAPIQQPRAWLDVMASANTTMNEKNEAMEEIQILAKDKKHARVFLDEGILDSLMWIVNNYFAKVQDGSIPPDEAASAKLAASCCVTLGKAHCALVHTGGDLLLMSMYEHGKVPEDRQLAQMLYETPHHVNDEQQVFVLKSLTMSQAQELARSLMQLAGVDSNNNV